MGRIASRALALPFLVWQVACSSDAAGPAPQPEVARLRPPPSPHPGGELVYESSHVFDRGGNLLSATESGPLENGHWQRAARPWTHLDDPYIYREQAWQRALSDGRSLHGYRIVRTPNLAPPPARQAAAAVVVDPRLASLARGAAPLTVRLTLRDFPRWDIPLVPPPSLRAEDRLVTLTERAAALEARGQLFRTRASDLRAFLDGAGAKVLGLGSGGGWLIVRATPSVLAALRTRTDIARIDVSEGHFADAANFSIGEARDGNHINVDNFLAAGYSGEGPNPDRHDYPDIALGVNELGSPEDEGCYLADGYGCESQTRVLEKIDCGGSTPGAQCQTVSNFDDQDDPLCVPGHCSRHATQMTSTALADYSGGQGDGLKLGDADPTCLDGSCVHEFLWRNRATGLAPEAGAVLWGNHPQDHDDYSQDGALAETFAGAITRHVDIVSNSWASDDDSFDCIPVPANAIELEEENAFDDGILVVQGGGNTAEDSTICRVASPSDTPKVFAVNGMQTGQSAGCETNYNSCKIVANPPNPNTSAASRGGATAITPDLQAHDGALSLIAVAAPTGLRFVTYEFGDHGSASTLTSGGSSQATAVVSGTAAVAKSYFLAHQEDKWINAPGRLFTVMLAMADRHFDTTENQRTTGADLYYGMGRVKLRRFDGSDPAGQSAMWTETLGELGELDWAPFAPLAEGTQLVKCVLLQDEDMSQKPYVSEVKLTVELRSCTEEDDVLDSLTDDSFDVKKLVALSAPPAGACVRVVITPVQLADTLTVHAFCFASSTNDDAKLPDGDNDGLVDAEEEAFGTDPTLPDSDGDGVSDGVEVHERLSSPIDEDTDRDGTGDATDPVTFNHCTTRRLGAPSITAPTSAPMTNPRPTLTWNLPANAEGALVELCTDKDCLSPFATIDASGTSAQPGADLPVGTTYWRAFARAGGDVGCVPSAIRRINRVLSMPGTKK